MVLQIQFHCMDEKATLKITANGKFVGDLFEGQEEQMDVISKAKDVGYRLGVSVVIGKSLTFMVESTENYYTSNATLPDL